MRGADLPRAPQLVKAEQKLEARPLDARLALRFPSQTFSMDFTESLSSPLVSSQHPGSMETVFHSAQGHQEAGYNCPEPVLWGESVSWPTAAVFGESGSACSHSPQSETGTVGILCQIQPLCSQGGTRVPRIEEQAVSRI